MEMKCLRMLDVIRLDRIKKNDERKELETEPIMAEIERGQLS